MLFQSGNSFTHSYKEMQTAEVWIYSPTTPIEVKDLLFGVFQAPCSLSFELFRVISQISETHLIEL